MTEYAPVGARVIIPAYADGTRPAGLVLKGRHDGHALTEWRTTAGTRAERWIHRADLTPAETAPCLDCGTSIACIDEPWYAVDCGGVCISCGKARGLGDEYLM